MLHIHEKKIVYFSAGVITALLLMIGFIAYPNINRLLELNQEITNLKNQLELKSPRQFALVKPSRGEKAAKKIIETDKNIFINQGAEFDLINELEGLASTLAVKLEINLDNKENSVNDSIYFLNLNLRAGGQTANLLTFLNRLEKIRTAIALTDLNFSNAGSANLLTAKGKIYVRK